MIRPNPPTPFPEREGGVWYVSVPDGCDDARNFREHCLCFEATCTVPGLWRRTRHVCTLEHLNNRCVADKSKSDVIGHQEG